MNGETKKVKRQFGEGERVAKAMAKYYAEFHRRMNKKLNQIYGGK